MALNINPKITFKKTSKSLNNYLTSWPHLDDLFFLLDFVIIYVIRIYIHSYIVACQIHNQKKNLLNKKNNKKHVKYILKSD